MADDKFFDDDALDMGADKADELGNLPPLSDFDSLGKEDSGDVLPPLGDFESQDTDLPDQSQRPALHDDASFAPETPDIGRGNTGAFNMGDEDIGLPAFDSGSFSKTSPDDDGQIISAGGFQDLAADSDFSPETPDLMSGPDSSLDTPIFDSAFGGDDSGFGDMDLGLVGGPSAATQAMEAPMFDDFIGEGDFAPPETAAATPAPDFSPDTGFGGVADDFAGVGAGVGEPVGAGVGVPRGAAARAPRGAAGAGDTTPGSLQTTPKKGGVSWLVAVIALVIGALIGMVNYPILSNQLAFLPNPLQAELDERAQTIDRLQQQLSDIQSITRDPDGKIDISSERAAELTREIQAKESELNGLTGQLDSARREIEIKQSDLSDIERELREGGDEIIAAREFLEELRNETAIVQARQRGLIAEVDRLTEHVGELDEANLRRVATKEALAHSVDRLIIQVKESIPLAPQKFDYAQRLSAVQQLREKVEQAPWVTPELQNEYTGFYLRELELARANDYFFANIIVTDRFGHRSQKWAECLMRGNSAVYYRTLDGANIGSFENIGTTDVPVWGYREEMPQEMQKSIEANIVTARIPDFESHAQLLAERELAGQEGSAWQRAYRSM